MKVMLERLLGAALLILCSCGGSESGPAVVAPDTDTVDAASDVLIDAAVSDASDASRSHPVLDQSCSESSSMNACNKCSDERCCETRDACGPECKAVFTCFNACTEGPAVCVDKCMAAHPTGAAAYAAQNACVNLYCTTQCSGKVDPCRDCRLANCAYEHVSCFADVECRRYGFCYEACTDAACDEACRAKVSADAVKLYGAYDSCLRKNCGSTCF